METEVIFQVERSPLMRPGIQIYGAQRNKNSMSVMKSVLLEQVDDGADYHEPLLTISENAAQCLFDELYRAGFRPTREDKVNQKTENSHITDLRKIAFKLLKIEG